MSENQECDCKPYCWCGAEDYKEKQIRLATNQGVEAMWNTVKTLIAKIERVREVHKSYGIHLPFCEVCIEDYPCPTIKALEGEQ